jgi:hypothetical protein
MTIHGIEPSQHVGRGLTESLDAIGFHEQAVAEP